jgi:hypothetical protein
LDFSCRFSSDNTVSNAVRLAVVKMNVGFKGTGRYVLVRLGAGSGEDVADGMRVGEATAVGEEVGGVV